MTIREIMKYIESEYEVINGTSCQICGGEYFADELEIAIVDGLPYDICSCICSNCGYEKIFEFNAPFVDNKDIRKVRKKLN
ncbi:MAG TPA: metal-binding protein [Clostridiaceae bacterium]